MNGIGNSKIRAKRANRLVLVGGDWVEFSPLPGILACLLVLIPGFGIVWRSRIPGIPGLTAVGSAGPGRNPLLYTVPVLWASKTQNTTPLPYSNILLYARCLVVRTYMALYPILSLWYLYYTFEEFTVCICIVSPAPLPMLRCSNFSYLSIV